MLRVVMLNEVKHLAREWEVSVVFMGCTVFGGQILRSAQDDNLVLIKGMR